MSICGFYEINNRIHIGQDARINKSEKAIFDSYFCFNCFPGGRMNFLNMKRQGTYSEKSYRLHFEKPFAHFAFNKHLVEAYCSGHKIIATDCSYIPKSGKETPHIGKFWSGCASKDLPIATQKKQH
jgi:hypothetical protein